MQNQFLDKFLQDKQCYDNSTASTCGVAALFGLFLCYKLYYKYYEEKCFMLSCAEIFWAISWKAFAPGFSGSTATTGIP